MDTTTLQLLLGVAANGLSAVLENSWSDATSLTVDVAIDSVRSDFTKLTEVTQGIDPEALQRFLGGPEFATAMHTLFIAHVHESDATTASIQEQFVSAFDRVFPGSNEAANLFAVLGAAVEKMLTVAAREGEPEAVDAIAAIRFRRLKEELAGLRSSLEETRATTSPDLQEYEKWAELYRSQILSRHGTITPPSLDTLDRVPVDDIYVAPKFRLEGPHTTDRELSPEQVAKSLDRTVVLGDPGAGKSTYAMMFAYDLAREHLQVPGGSLISFVINLKDYGAEKQNSRLSIIEWIEEITNSDYCASPPEGAISYFLAAGRAVVIFDGLDELLDTSYRREITADIETFASRFVTTPMLITSRRVGYAQAPLDPRRFDIFRLTELDEDQISRYASVWFSLRKELPQKQREQMSADFLSDSREGADDLRRNMLMLGLLCNLYRGDGYIPRHRPQVYEKCAVMLFERWDRGRRIVVQLEFERHLRPAMQHLAFWIYSNPSLRGGVTEAELVKSATDYLLERRFGDRDEARQEACRFVEFCRGRAWVFTDTGTTGDGDRLYQFTHRTFLEFFAAEHLVRTHPTPDDLSSVLLPRIRAGEWDVVAQLAFQLQDDNIDGAADLLLNDLVNQEDVDSDRDLLLNFAARTLSYLVPRRKSCRDVSRAVTERTWEWLMNEENVELEAKTGDPPETHAALVCADRENFDPVFETLKDGTLDLLSADVNALQAEAALEIAPNADMAMPGRRSAVEAWEEFRVRTFDLIWERVGAHAVSSRKIAYDGFVFGKASVDELVNSHTSQVLFDHRGFRLYGNRIRSPVIELFLSGQLEGARRPNGDQLGRPDELAQLGRILSQSSPPWDSTEMLHSGLSYHFRHERLSPWDADLEGSALFGAFAILAATAERIYFANESDLLLDGIAHGTGWVELLAPWIMHRFGGPQIDFPVLPLEENDLDVINGWSIGHWSVTVDPKGGDAVAMRSTLAGAEMSS
jgi:hypothetical protein